VILAKNGWCCVNCISSADSVMVFQAWSKHFSYLEYDKFQGIPSEEIKSDMLEVACVLRIFYIVSEENVKEWLQNEACELAFQQDRHKHCFCCHKRQGR
jgi:hypothetical protein